VPSSLLHSFCSLRRLFLTIAVVLCLAGGVGLLTALSAPSSSVAASAYVLPTITYDHETPAASASGWNSGDVTLYWNCSDPGGPGVVAPAVSTVVTGEGPSLPGTGTCTDQNGNKVSDTKQVKIDRTKPTIAFERQSPAANRNGWNNGGVLLSWVCADPGGANASGPVAPTVTVTVAGEGASLPTTGTCTDGAGNTSDGDTRTVKIDRTKPVIRFDHQTPAARGRWNTANVTLYWNCSDPRGAKASGVVSSAVRAIVTAEGRGLPATGTCADKAGNDSANTRDVDIDRSSDLPRLVAGLKANPTLSQALLDRTTAITKAIRTGAAKSACPKLAGLGSFATSHDSQLAADRLDKLLTAIARHRTLLGC
jgi:flagellin-like hook-associated protein FlgL